jgi:LPXTG-motif cell wall-anchored protein
MRTVLSLLFFLGLAGTLFAMHEVDHRFTVLGYVRDGQGEGKSGIVVTLEHKGGVKQQETTNSSGYYQSVFHLHDGNLGDEIIVTAGAEVKRIVTVFDVDDKHSVREGRLDFGAKAKDEPLYWFPIGGLLLLCVAIYVSVKKKRKQSEKKDSVTRSGKRKK